MRGRREKGNVDNGKLLGTIRLHKRGPASLLWLKFTGLKCEEDVSEGQAWPWQAHVQLHPSN
jgi:hypothetical protein